MSRWISLHLHWQGDLDRVLLAAVAPTVADLEADGWIRGFFFVRFPEGGPHLRLRLDRSPDAEEAALETRVRRELGRLLQTIDRTEEPLAELPPDGTLLRRPYEPEVLRYGGPAGLAVAERCFVASSRAALDALGELSAAGASARRGFAVALLATAAHAFGLSPTAGRSFLDAVAEDGFRQVQAASSEASRGWPSEERMRQAFAAGYERQKEIVVGRVDCVWRAAEAGELGGLRPWHRLWSATAGGLLGVWRRGGLQGRPHLRWPAGEALGAACWPTAGILFDLIHMSNNRLGLVNHDEIHLAWLTARALEAVGGSR